MNHPLFLTALLASAVSSPAETAWVIDQQPDWQEAVEHQTALEFIDGMAVPSAGKSTLTTKLKRYPSKRSASSLRIEQSPVWDNWEPTPNIGPANLGDAPVMLSLGPDDYWMFGRYQGTRGPKGAKARKPVEFRPEPATLEGFDVPLTTTPYPNQFNAPGGLQKSLGGYHAWQSRDMVNWVHHGPITEGFAKWMTTAEFFDGKAYFYYDFPNDQDPHLYIDADLTDGKPGENVGLAFDDPTHGSDCTVIRDLEGSFHIIAEDWSPIHAQSRSWDSPLATHGVSKDGKAPFKILAPPVDTRTKPTGKIGTYKHPHWAKEHPEKFKTNIAEYEIHEPEQEAYGDWAAIAIGGQYYLFGDYDPAGGHEMSVGRFTASSIDGPFQWCGHVGKGHPDPDVMFAEGRFYLATQQNSDFTSPGPWVEKVEARVGVDSDNDGKVDQWSEWQELKESYDYTPGFSKQIARTPAELDLSGLPAGFGFQIDVRLTDTTENESKPILDKLVLSF
jgi:hypothetical protein